MSFKKSLYGFWGGVYVPPEILEKKEKTLLHISDTPANIYPGIKKLIHKLKPEYIIHTGDMVDNIKIDIYPQQISEYKQQVKQLIEIMENSAAQIIITLGNHDSRDIIEGFCKRSIVTERGYSTEISGYSFNMSHFSQVILEAPAQYNLFGHDLSIESGVKDEKIYLNGICNINVIKLESMDIFYLPYPWGTNDLRLCKRRFKI